MPDNRMPVGSLGPRDFRNEVPQPRQEEQKKHLEQVTKGKVTTRERSSSDKFLDNYFNEDVKIVKRRIWEDIIEPKIQDIAMAIFEIIVYKGNAAPRRGSGKTTYVDYSGYSTKRSDSRDRDERPRTVQASRRSNDLDDIIFEDRRDAEQVLTELVELTQSQYQQATVADLMELVGTTTMSFTDNKWGWKDLSPARVKRVRDGYLLDLPRPILLDE